MEDGGWRIKDEVRRAKDLAGARIAVRVPTLVVRTSFRITSFVLPPSSFVLRPSSFVLPPSSFVLCPSSFAFFKLRLPTRLLPSRKGGSARASGLARGPQRRCGRGGERVW